MIMKTTFVYTGREVLTLGEHEMHVALALAGVSIRSYQYSFIARSCPCTSPPSLEHEVKFKDRGFNLGRSCQFVHHKSTSRCQRLSSFTFLRLHMSPSQVLPATVLFSPCACDEDKLQCCSIKTAPFDIAAALQQSC